MLGPSQSQEPLMTRRLFLAITILAAMASHSAAAAPHAPDHRYLYVVCPGIRNYLEFGGAGILVFDIDAGHKFVRRIATPASREAMPDNVKGVCACAATRRLYFTTQSKLVCLDLTSDQMLWEVTPPNGTDRMSIT